MIGTHAYLRRENEALWDLLVLWVSLVNGVQPVSQGHRVRAGLVKSALQVNPGLMELQDQWDCLVNRTTLNYFVLNSL